MAKTETETSFSALEYIQQEFRDLDEEKYREPGGFRSWASRSWGVISHPIKNAGETFGVLRDTPRAVWSGIRRFVPTKNGAKLRVKREQMSGVRRALVEFLDLPGIGLEDKKRAVHRVKRVIMDLFHVRAVVDVLTELYILSFLLVGLVVGLIAGPIMCAAIHRVNMTFWEFWGPPALYVLIVFSAIAALALIPILVASRVTVRVQSILLIPLSVLWPLALVASSIISVVTTSNFTFVGFDIQLPIVSGEIPQYALLSGAVSFGLMWLWLWLSMGAAFLTEALGERRTRSEYPEAIVIISLVSALAKIHSTGYSRFIYGNWPSLELRTAIAYNIAKASSAIDNDLPGVSGTGHVPSDELSSARYARIAQGLRATIEWVMFPMKDTRTNLGSRLGGDLLNILEGDWHSLTQEEPSPVVSSRFKLFLLTLAKSGIVGSLLIASGIVLDQLPADQDGRIGEMIGYATTALIVGGVLVMLTSLEPLLGGGRGSFWRVIESLTRQVGSRSKDE